LCLAVKTDPDVVPLPPHITPPLTVEDKMKLSIEAELVYNFASDTQIIANLEASRASDQIILSESLDIQPPAQALSDTTPYGDRRIRTSLSGEVAIRYRAVVENNLRQLLPPSGCQHVWSDLPGEVLPFLLPSRFCPSDKFMRFAQREFGGAGDGVARIMAILEWLYRNVDYVVSAYALQLDPPDFHAIFEVYLENGWWLIDPTRLAPIEGIVRIGSGRDASDIAFLTSDKQCQMVTQTVLVSKAP
jgi:transglutaminase-like putative cysteine protease